jgi:outer membrane lipoprotein-sorting protein
MSRFGIPEFFFFVSLFIAGQQAPAADVLSGRERTAVLEQLAAIHRRNPGMTASFVERKTSRLLKEPLVTSGTIAFQSPDKFRRRVTGNSPSLSVCDGKTLWIYYPKFREAERYDLGSRGFFDDALAALTVGLSFQNVENYYRLGMDHYRGGYRIVLTPRRRQLSRVIRRLIIYLTSELKVRRTDTVLPNQDRVVTDYRNVQRGSIPDSTFKFRPPSGTNVTRPLGK